jgi:excisionase family DNA binding protein
MINSSDPLLTIKEVQKRLNIHYNTLLRYLKSGAIPVVTLTSHKRYIRESDLNNYLSKHTVNKES